MVVVEVAAEVFVVEVAAGVEERTVVASVVVLTVVSVVAVFVAVVLMLLTLRTKSLQPSKQNHRISNIISSSFLYRILTYLLHHDNRRCRLVISTSANDDTTWLVGVVNDASNFFPKIIIGYT